MIDETTVKRIDDAMEVLAWLSQQDIEPELKDDIGRVRDRLWDMADWMDAIGPSETA